MTIAKTGWYKKIPTLLFCTVFSFLFVIFITDKTPIYASNQLTVTVEDAYYGEGLTISVNSVFSLAGINIPHADMTVNLFQVVNGTEVELEEASATTDSQGDATIILNGTLGDLTVGEKIFTVKTSSNSTSVAVNILPYNADNKVGFLSGGVENDNKIWYKAGQDVVISSPSGFSISNSFALVSNEWKSSISVPAFGTEGEASEYTYYLKNNSSGAISQAKTAEFYTDLMAPTGVITINDVEFTYLSTTVNLGFFYNDTPKVEIEGSDGNGSGIKSVEFFVDDEAQSKSAMPSIEDIEWGTYRGASGVSIEDKTISVVYARITDLVGNVSYLSADAVVLFVNSAASAKDVEFEKTDTKDLRVTLTSSGNTVDEVSINGSSVSTKDYTAKTSGSSTALTFTAEYLNTLKQGVHEVEVSYNPLGEEFFEMEGYDNDVPRVTEFELSIFGAQPKASWKPTEQTSTFTGESITYTGEGNIQKGDATGSVSYRYYTSKTGGSPLATSPSKEGKYYVEAVIAADDNHAEYALTPRVLLTIVDENSGTVGGSSGSGSANSSGTGGVGGSGGTDSTTTGSGNTGTSGTANGSDISSDDTSGSQGLFFLFPTNDVTGEVIPPSDEDTAQDKYSAFVGKEVSSNGITWLNVGDLATVGVDNTGGIIPSGAQFWVKVIDGSGSTADWNDYYNEVDSEYRERVDTDSAMILHVGILLQDGRTFDEVTTIPILIQNSNDWDTESLHALYITQGREEPISLTSSQMHLSGESAFAMDISKFSPIVIYELLPESVIEEALGNIGGLINNANQSISDSLFRGLDTARYVAERVLLAILCLTIAFGVIFGLSRVVKRLD